MGIVGKDNDLGYGIMRVDEDQRWYPAYLGQPLWNFINACFFEYGIAAYDLELGKNLRTPKEKRSEEFKRRASNTLRKIRGSANISGSDFMHLMTGNLSHQIEHHLFPDLPSNRYAEVAPQAKEIFDEYGLTYLAAPLPKQVASAWHRVVRL